MSQIWRGVSGGIEVLENVNEMADLPDISTIDSEGVWYIESGGFGPDYIAPTNWDSSAGEFTDWFSLFDGQILVDIPDAVAVRPDDDDAEDRDDAFGLRITTEVEWDDRIGAEISSNTSGATRAIIYRVSDSTIMGQTDISDLASGDTFTLELDNPLEPFDDSDATRYQFVVDANGSTYTRGFATEPNFPFTSDDGDLSIVGGAFESDIGDAHANCLKRVGNVGLD